MPSSSNVIKGKLTGEEVEISGISLPVFSKPGTNSNMQAYPSSALPELTPAVSSYIGDASDSSTIQVGRSKFRSTVLHRGQGQSQVNGWSVPVIQGNISHHLKAPTSAYSEELNRHFAQSKDQAAEIIAEANNKAAQILAEAKNEIESQRRQAFMEGMNAAKSEAAQSMHQVTRILQETQLWREQVMHQSQGNIIDMIIEIGRKLFGDGFELPAERLDHIVSRAINEGSRLGNLRIYLHPEDSKILVNLWQESEITVNGQHIQIISSQNISRGGCFVDGQFGVVDGRVEEQIDQISETLKPVVTNLEALDQ
jgi:flagellar assembly protein FliH